MSPLHVRNDLHPYPGAHPAVLATSEILRRGVHGITSQFREQAAIYDERYLDIESKRRSIEQAFNVVGRRPNDDIAILDIGAGSGNATFALANLFPQSLISCTDLSPELLSILASRAEQLGLLEQISPFVADASTLELGENSLDLVVGSSMVHHLLDPSSFLERMILSLRPGGVAIFFEPFQAGHLVVRLLLASLVQMSEHRDGLTQEHVDFFRRYIFTIDTMFREDRDDPVFAQLDDKWMFTRTMFQRVADRVGARMGIFSTNAAERPFHRKISDLLMHGLGEDAPLPEWCCEFIDSVDANVGEALREELLTEGGIVFLKEDKGR